jgi:hypothetical protein
VGAPKGGIDVGDDACVEVGGVHGLSLARERRTARPATGPHSHVAPTGAVELEGRLINPNRTAPPNPAAGEHGSEMRRCVRPARRSES